jgi:hypothetical protein
VRIAIRVSIVLMLLIVAALGQELPRPDAVRVAEFYRLAPEVADKIWGGWSKTPAPLLLVTPEAEFLFHHPAPPGDFTKIQGDIFARPKQFDTGLLATFPAFGPPSVIVVGQPQNTTAKTSTPWLIVVMHEHFHQLQHGYPGYYDALKALGLSRGDNGGTWMLNYPFPYDRPEVAQSFGHLRDLLLAALAEPNRAKARRLAKGYAAERKRVFAQLTPDDHKYIAFQLWQEGIARYTQIKVAEAAAGYKPTDAFRDLPDYEPFATHAAKARTETLAELKEADMAKWKRVFVYSFGAAEGLLLDRLHPGWQDAYFKHLLTTDPLFD